MADASNGTLCPSCGELIPAGAAGCSRCGYDTRQGPARASPVHPGGNPYAPATGGGVFIRHPDLDQPIWQETAFKVVAIVILVEGILEVLLGVIALAKSGGGGGSVGHGALMTMVGIGLLAEWSWASLALKIACWVNLVLGAGITLIGLFMISSGPLGWLVAGVRAVFLGMY